MRGWRLLSGRRQTSRDGRNGRKAADRLMSAVDRTAAQFSGPARHYRRNWSRPGNLRRVKAPVYGPTLRNMAMTKLYSFTRS
jgi:hypothetical protein